MTAEKPWIKLTPKSEPASSSLRGSGKLNVMGSMLLSILCGHWRFAHINAVRGGNTVNAGLLGIARIVSQDVARTALKRMIESRSLE